jgi:hypothetical protein
MTRDRMWALAATALAAVTIALGFYYSGSPAQRRLYEADNRRVSDLREIGNALYRYWESQPKDERKLPEKLSDLAVLPHGAPVRLLDPVTWKPYGYRLIDGSKFELCAEFAEASAPPRAGEVRFWAHKSGRNCFTLDARMQAPWQ